MAGFPYPECQQYRQIFKKKIINAHQSSELHIFSGNVQGKLIMEDLFSCTYNEHQRKLRSGG